MNMLSTIKRKATVNSSMILQTIRNYATKDVYVGNLAYTVVEDDLKTLFKDEVVGGEIQEFRIPIDRFSGQIRGFAFLTMDENQATDFVRKYDGMDLMGRTIKVNLAIEKKPNM